MFVLIHEFFHGNKPSKYYVDTTKLDVKNFFLDYVLVKKIKNKSFTQEIEVNIDLIKEIYPDYSDWHHPQFTKTACKKRLPKNQIVKKQVDFYITTLDE